MIAPPASAQPPLRRVDASESVTRDAAATRAGLGALLRYARATRRLPTAARAASAHHALSPALPAPAALHRLVGALTGRLTVVNHPPAAALPSVAVALVRGLAWAALHGADDAPPAPGAAGVPTPGDGRDARERALVRAWRAEAAARGDATRWLAAGGARWVAAALYEDEAPAVGRAPAGAAAPGAGPAVPQYVIAARYYMAVFAGRGAAPPARERLDAAAARALAAGGHGAGRPWFTGRVLVADAWVTARMAPEVRAEWAAVTGRAGAGDHYWYPDSWLRFLEAGRVVGCVSADDVARSRPGRLRGAEPAGAAPSPDAPYAVSAPRIERGICVPPGYCLAECAGALATAAVLVD